MDGEMRVSLSIVRKPTDEWKVSVTINGLYNEDATSYHTTKEDALSTLELQRIWYAQRGYIVTLSDRTIKMMRGAL